MVQDVNWIQRIRDVAQGKGWKSKEHFMEAADFDIKGLETFGGIGPVGLKLMMLRHPAKLAAYQKWWRNLTPRQRLMVELRRAICPLGAEVYYRNCETFQGKKGKRFAEKAASFWNARVIGHTHVIGAAQPGRKTLDPGEKASWSDTEGTSGQKKHIWKTIFKVGLKHYLKKIKGVP